MRQVWVQPQQVVAAVAVVGERDQCSLGHA